MQYELDHGSVVCCVRYSDCGKYLATGCNRKAQIYSVETGEKIQYDYIHNNIILINF